MRINTCKQLILPFLFVTGLLQVSTALATEFQVAQLAAELTRASNQLAAGLGSARGYSSVRFSAERLSREAGELVDAIRRDRSRSYISAEFSDIGRHYLALEDAFLRANGGNHAPGLNRQVSLISNLYASLDATFRFTHRAVPPYYYPVPVPPRRGHDVPRVPETGETGRQDRRDYGRIRARRVLEFNHDSPVLQRQYRRETEQDRVQRIMESRHGSGRSFEFRP